MRQINLAHEINCNVETFWKVFFDKEFNTSLFLKELGFPSYQIVEKTETDTAIIRVIKGQPKMSGPKAMMKLIGDSFGYQEDGRLDRNTGVFTWKMTPNKLAGKLRCEGTVRAEPLGDDKCKRLADITVEAKVFGIGGVIESNTEKQFREGWDQSASYMNRWLKEH